MTVTIHPSKAKGNMTAPPSKSMAHRVLICAGLSEGESILHNVASSEDVLATLDCLAAMGAGYTFENGTVTMRGVGAALGKAAATLPCRECGSTIRFFVPLCLRHSVPMTLTGSEKLLSRPMSVYEKICAEQGIAYEKTAKGLSVCGKLRCGEYEVPGDISSQFISGLLFALPLFEGDSTIRMIPPVESRPYINMTIQTLSDFGVEVSWADDHTLFVRGNQKYVPCETDVEGDYSNAAFFEAFNSIGGEVHISGLREDSLQGDKVYLEHMKALQEGKAEIDLSACPDLGPILMAMAAMQHGAHFTGTRRLKIKESDRGTAMAQELLKFGVRTTVCEDEITVDSTGIHAPTEILHGHNDHRIVMTMATMASVFGGTIDDAHAVRKSLPDYYERLQALGIEVEVNGMDQ